MAKETPEIVLHDCLIARRGKGAKGTIAIQTLGKPIKVKDSIVTKKWDYSFVDNLTVQQCLDAAEKLGIRNARLLKESIVRGAELVNKSATIKAQSAETGIINFIIEHKLVMTKEDAKNLCNVWLQTQAFMKRSNMLIPSIEDLAEQRRKFIKDQTAKGLWDCKLVDNREDSESEDDSDEDDSEDLD